MKPLRPTHPYIPMARGFVYVAFVIDAYARRIVAGVSHGQHMRASCSMRWSKPP